MQPDEQLLRSYHVHRSEADFEELVRRHGPLVYGAALRSLNGDADLARDVTQMVFADLAQKTASIVKHQSIVGWLYKSARFASAKLARSEQRRRAREEAASALSLSESAAQRPDAQTLGPLIDDALQDLKEDDREAVLLRYFETRDYGSLGSCLGVSQEAARKRVFRALERLRVNLQRRGISSSEAALEAALSGAAAVAMPGELHACILKSALQASLLNSPSISSRLLQLSDMKTAILLTGLAVALVTMPVLQRRSVARLRSENASLAAELAAVTQSLNEANAHRDPDQFSRELAQVRQDRSELLRLRDEVTRLRAAQRRVAAADLPVDQQEPALATQQVTLETRFLEGKTSSLKKWGLDTIGVDVTGDGTTTILTDQQFRTLLEGLESQAGIDLLAAQNVVTLHNRAASITTGPAEDSDNQTPALGPTADILPIVSSDRQSISLQATAGFAEQMPNEKGTETEPKQVRHTSLSGNAVMSDGQTLVLAQRIGHSDSRMASGGNPDSLVVFVTSTLVDAAGNRTNPRQSQR